MHVSSWKRLSAFLVPILMLASLTVIAQPDSYYLKDDQDYIEKTEKKETESKIPENIAYNIKATRLPDPGVGKCAIQVTFEVRPDYTGDYVLARASQVIDTPDKVAKAQVLQTVSAGTTNTILDTDCTPGSRYYVVVSKKSVNDDAIVLVRDVNLTTTPIVLYAPETVLRVTGLRAVDAPGSKVKLSWKPLDKTGMLYTIYRNRNAIDSAERLREAQLVKVVPDTGEYLDEGIVVSGTYFYAVTAKVMYGSEDTTLVKDENFTSTGVPITIIEKIAPKSIRARLEGGGAVISWDYTGAQGETGYTLGRSDTLIKNTNERPVTGKLFEVDITKKTFADTELKPGSYWYWIAPRSIGDKDSYELVPGVNITETPVSVREIEKKKELSSDIDRILKRTFFRGLYAEAVRQLQDFITNTDNQEAAAKARLFIGRSYIEQGRYREALDFLLLADVKNYFPKEAEFWTEFALSRVRSY